MVADEPSLSMAILRHADTSGLDSRDAEPKARYHCVRMHARLRRRNYGGPSWSERAL